MTTANYKSIASNLKGGYKQSGSLTRDNGTEALDQYLQTKTIWISHLLNK